MNKLTTKIYAVTGVVVLILVVICCCGNPDPGPVVHIPEQISQTPQPLITKVEVTTKPKRVKVSKTPKPKKTKVYYANCDAVRAAGKDPLLKGQPGYAPKLDRNSDGVACETD